MLPAPSKMALLTLALVTLEVLAGPAAYAACYGGCLGTCFTIGAVAMGLCPPAGVSGAAACTSSCAGFCAASALGCFDDDATAVRVGKSGAAETVPIAALEPEQMVWTLESGERRLTRVVQNIRVQGPFGFVEILASDGRELFNLTVTAEHNMARLRSAGSSMDTFDEGLFEMVLARELQIGEQIPVVGPFGKAMARITSSRLLQRPFKNVLTTAAGSVLANNVFTSTICDDKDPLHNHSNFSAALIQWRELHAAVLLQ